MNTIQIHTARRLLCAAFFLAPIAAQAQFFIEVGVGASTGGCIYNGAGTVAYARTATTAKVTPGCSRNPLGLFAIGYQFNDQWRVQWDHWSSLPDMADRGTEIVSIRYRYTFR